MNKKNKKQNKVRVHSLSFRNSWGVALILIIIITISSCRKYPEGGSYFLTNMTDKIAGNYNFTHYYIDGKDSVNYYFNNDYVGILKLFYSKGYSDLYIDFTLAYHNNEGDLLNNWEYISFWYWNDSKRKSIRIEAGGFRDTTISGPLTENKTSIWDIKKLKDNELIIETDYNNKHYRAELKK